MNLWVVFLISGLWHGANWTFLAWGAYYGFFLCVEKYCSEAFPKLQDSIPSFVKFSLTLLIVLFGWVLFRSPSISYAIAYMKVMLGFSPIELNTHPWGYLLGNRGLFLLILGAGIVFFKLPSKGFKLPNWLTSPWSETMTMQANTAQLSLLFISTVLLLTLATMGMFSAGYTAFLYFRF
jgi:alginate O-acetyltransferase complex protein AlgI